MLASPAVSIPKRAALAAVSGLLPLLVAREAAAQLHGDVGVNVGAMDRVRSGGIGSGGVGPVAEIEAHLALLPLLRVGVYASHDWAPNSIDGAAWQVTSAGLHLKGLLPFVRGAFRAWIFAGAGYAGVYAPSYDYTFDFGDQAGPRHTYATGAGGSFFEVPLGIGVGWKFVKPWMLVAQLGARIDFGFVGSIYDDQPGRTVIPDGGPVAYIGVVGRDWVAPFLTVGIALDR